MASEEYLPVTLDSRRLLIESSTVKEILGRCVFVRVPHATAQVPGVVPYGGTVIPLIDLGALVTEDGDSPGEVVRDRTLVLDDGDLVIAICTDKVREVIRIETNEARESLRPIAAFASREFELDGHVNYVLDLGGLIAAARLAGDAGGG